MGGRWRAWLSVRGYQKRVGFKKGELRRGKNFKIVFRMIDVTNWDFDELFA